LLLKRFGIFEAYDFSIEKILLEPFISGCQNPLIIPMWFLLQLFLLNIIFQFIYWSGSENNFYAITLLIVIIGLFSAYKGLADFTGWRLLVVRTGIAAIFFQFGIIISRYRNKIIPFLKDPVILFSIWIVVVLITAYFGNIEYSIIWGSVKNQLFYIPVLTSCLIVLIVVGISQILSESIDNNSLLITIGQNTFYIMALHFSFFFLVNVVFYVIGKINKENLNDVFFKYEVSKNFIFYLVAGIIGPVIVGKVDKKLKQKIRSLLNYRTTALI